MLHGKPILERYRGTQPLKTILFHVLLVSVLPELRATAGQRVCVCSFSVITRCLQAEWAWFHCDRQSQSRARQALGRLSSGVLDPLCARQQELRHFASFFILLFILMLVELAMASVFLVYSREIDTYFEKDLMQSLEIYRQSHPEGNKTIKDDFDAVQHLFRCCGVHGEADWKGNVPISCCTEDPCNTLSHTNWQEGCLLKLRNWSARNYLSTGAGVVTMFIIQFICLSITVPLFCHFSRHGLGYK
ncbi:leukocyte surface antigen CD53-like isoform X1 [Acanthopagrus latus]|uniref:leukocyte surface antigen CD53-like isoform X1 n=1 Tax=Acanthopagrus latus TaxID=8177 RepID=UPI00187CF6E8|nr:leukocyte surface antigen CD53-like isoform X1 [Acanthopagrus latus]